jgi:C-terminal processing protease CtpA/Prc
MRKAILVVAVAVLVMAGVARAGEKGKCPYDTQVCLDQMVENLSGAGMIGLDGEWEEELGGYRIEKFAEGTTAENAGVRVGDLLIKVNGISMTDKEAYLADAKKRKPDQRATITVLRDGAERTMTVTLIRLTTNAIAHEIGLHLFNDHVSVAAAGSE